MKLINILKEIRVRSGRILFPQDIKDINVVFEFFGESDSDFDLHKPMTEYRYEHSFEFDDEEDQQHENDVGQRRHRRFNMNLIFSSKPYFSSVEKEAAI
jgi:hypothetical protein